MLITTSGIVIREKYAGESGKFIDVLTKDMGVIEISVKGSNKITAKNSSSSQLFAYSKFCFQQRGDRYYLNSSEPIHIFYGLRLDVEKVALASYFSEIISYAIPANENSEEILRLFLNSLYMLSEGKRTCAFIKCVFELRLLSDIGMMPDLLVCRKCLRPTADIMYFFIQSGCIICGDCCDGGQNTVKLDPSMLHTIRYIVLIENKKLWNFKMSVNVQKTVSLLAENYLISQLGKSFKTLNFYYNIIGSDIKNDQQ